MAKRLKDAGLTELEALRKRVNRQRALSRIQEYDAQVLLGYIEDIEDWITNMYEVDDQGNRREF